MINRVIGVREGGVLRAKGNPEPLQLSRERAVRMLLRAAENHVLDEVGQTAFVVAFMQRAHHDHESKGDPVPWFRIGPDDVAQAVGQCASQQRRIGRQIARKLWPDRGARIGVQPGNYQKNNQCASQRRSTQQSLKQQKPQDHDEVESDGITRISGENFAEAARGGDIRSGNLCSEFVRQQVRTDFHWGAIENFKSWHGVTFNPRVSFPSAKRKMQA